MTTPPVPAQPASDAGPHGAHGGVAGLTLGALGIVFGDIGTSPLYAFLECLRHGGDAADEATIFGLVSLLFWSLTLVVTVKYVATLMYADNHGEGGIMALQALLPASLRAAPGGRVAFVSLLVIAGAALLFGDGVITPAISVLSAMEGLIVVQPGLEKYVVPLTVGILVALFAVQSRGTELLGRLFGPIMLLWFAVIGGLGLYSTFEHPAIWQALSPVYAVRYFAHHGIAGVAILGSVVLAVTGGEALYADMGHFGRLPIRIAWGVVVYPCLTLSYLGQGALILHRPETVASPFFSMVPTGGWTYALVALAGAATVIASQALISAVFSLTHQALRLGFLPRVQVAHTSSEMQGQIYVSVANWLLAISTIALVLGFQKSSALAAAYGLAVAGTMGITSVVFGYVTWYVWKWPRWLTIVVVAAMLAIDLPFFGATMLKFLDGGYLPFALGALLFVVMSTWVAGRALLTEHLQSASSDIDTFRDALPQLAPNRLPGLAVVMTSSGRGTPPVLERIFLLTVTNEGTPYVDPGERLAVEAIGGGLFRVTARYGFMESPVVASAVLHAIAEAKVPVGPADAVYLLGRESFMETSRGKMTAWRERLFGFLSKNAADPTLYFHLPPEQVVEIGSRVDL